MALNSKMKKIIITKSTISQTGRYNGNENPPRLLTLRRFAGEKSDKKTLEVTSIADAHEDARRKTMWISMNVLMLEQISVCFPPHPAL